MTYFYLDESIHDDAGFIIVACVYSKRDLNKDVHDLIVSNNLDPKTSEFKSNANYSKQPEKKLIREELKKLMNDFGRVGIVVLPRNKRKEIGVESFKALRRFIDSNKYVSEPSAIYIDQGLVASDKKAKSMIEHLGFNSTVFHLQVDSKMSGGVQLADLCAHNCSIQLKEHMGLIKKKVKVSEGHYEDIEMELGFEMFADLRYSFFHQGTKKVIDDPIEDATLDVEPYGLFISDFCNERLTQQARSCFGRIYLGCIR